jgi:tripartite-type tricarboxylate transporter receptor subunit TctC
MQFGSAGTGSLAHLTGLRFMYETKTDMLHVPYKGLAPAMNDLYSGQVNAIFDNVSSALTHIKSGKVCALAVQAPARLAALPDVPTYQELGFPTLNRPTWYGLVAPANTPRPVIEKLNNALNAALAAPEVRSAFARMGVTPAPSTPEEFSEQIRQEIGMWKETTEKMKFEKIRQ